jgi:adenosylhomocysteinase
MCATGNRSLRRHDFAALHPGAYVASVTSSDDELELPDTYHHERICEHIVRYVSDGHHFHALNGGDAVNFVHGGIAGPFIRLVQAEILAACALISERDLAPGFYEVGTADRRTIADTWLAHYVGGLGT